MSSKDLSVFRSLNEGKTAWSERADVIKKSFPSTALLDWYEVFRQDPTILGNILNDVIKLSQERSGKPGKRPSPDEKEAVSKFRRIQDDDYSNETFAQSFKALAANSSVRAVAVKVGVDKSLVHRLLNGQAIPSMDVIEKVAKAYGKHPSYFVEYRVAYIMAIMSHSLSYAPESSVVLYKRVAGRSEKAL
jgi:DNA-binding phage protein